ncbi:MAG: hypothetical protein HEQ23_10155 [Tepidisphaera sp.]
MGTNLPRTIPELANWANTRSALWQLNGALVGLQPGQITGFKNLVTAFIAARDAAEAARVASKNATEALDNAVRSVRTTGGQYVNLIKAFAESTNNPNVYVLAGVSPNDAPGTPPAPNAPDQFTVGVNGDGSLTLRWKVAQPTGVGSVVYVVSRRINGGEGPFSVVGTAGGREKSFTDGTLPVGVDQVEYIVTARRGNEPGVSGPIFKVQFGSVGSGGSFTIASAESTGEGPVGLAA